jgi:hypothetical protein
MQSFSPNFAIKQSHHHLDGKVLTRFVSSTMIDAGGGRWNQKGSHPASSMEEMRAREVRDEIPSSRRGQSRAGHYF